MKKNCLLAAMALVALASCTSDEFVGENTPSTTGNQADAIQFVSSTPRVTRSEGASAAEELGYSFAVYATKTVGTTTSNVFAHNPYHATTNTPYWVWYNTSSANSTTSNTHDWEYVGAAGSKTIPGGTYTLSTTQEIKFWDYSADNYVFTAYKNKSGGDVTNLTTDGFTFQGTAAQVGNLYVADKLTITDKANPAAHTTADNKIGDAVKLTFRSAATKVRLGIYETIPGYVVKNVNFRPANNEFTATGTNATLSGSFHGASILSSSSDDTYTFTITYDATTNVAQLATSGSSTPSNHFDFGTFTSSSAIGETSTAPTWATSSSAYSLALPNTDQAGNMILYVDYDLYNDVSKETIHVTGAKAVVPSTYMKWNPNYAYTYLFKISDNTNGYTGEGTLPSGLWPISFDAVTVAATDVSEGSITTVSTPSITTYQDGSVSTDGITYANRTDKPIYITVNTNGTLETLNASGTTVKLYTVAEKTTEADLLLASNYTKTEVAGTDIMTVETSGITVNSVTFTANQYAKFSPVANTTYAFEYSKAAVAATYKAATGTYDSSIKYYTDNTGATEVTGLTAGADVSSYFVVDNPGSPAEKAYKVIKVVSGS